MGEFRVVYVIYVERYVERVIGFETRSATQKVGSKADDEFVRSYNAIQLVVATFSYLRTS